MGYVHYVVFVMVEYTITLDNPNSDQDTNWKTDSNPNHLITINELFMITMKWQRTFRFIFTLYCCDKFKIFKDSIEF